MVLLKKYGYPPKATHQRCSLSSLGLLYACMESRVADDYDGIVRLLQFVPSTCIWYN